MEFGQGLILLDRVWAPIHWDREQGLILQKFASQMCLWVQTKDRLASWGAVPWILRRIALGVRECATRRNRDLAWAYDHTW